MDKLQNILRRVKDLPMLPSITKDVLGMLDDPDIHILKMAEAIQKDFTLSSNLLKMANSAYYAQDRQIATILEAIVLLGTKSIRKILLSASAHGMMNKKVEGYLLEKEDLWKHSLCCAVSCEVIAAKSKSKNRDIAYTSGLLHDIGKLILAHYVEEEFVAIMEMVENRKIPFDEAEIKVIGFSHAQLGGKLLEMWNFHPDMVSAVAHHHEPELAHDPHLASIVHLGDMVAMMTGLGVGADGLMYNVKDGAFESAGLPKSDIDQVIEQVVTAMQSLEGEV